MKSKTLRAIGPIAIILGAGALTLFPSCAGTSGGVYASSGPAPVWDEDYVYYPGYETYYSRNHNFYYYRDHDRWVRNANPPRQWANNAPSVHVDFRDAPDRHHADVVKHYPRNWHPQATPPDHRDDHRK